MKTKLIIAIIISVILLQACGKGKETESELSPILSGNHELRRFSVRESTVSTGGFFLLFGSYRSDEIMTVKFAWKSLDDEYIISELPISKIRVKIDSTIAVPYIKFRWSVNGMYVNKYSDMESVFRNNIIYAVVVCKDEDWAIKIDMSEL